MLDQSTERTAPVSTTPAMNDAQALGGAPELPAGVADLDQAREKRRGRVICKATPDTEHGLGRYDYRDRILSDRNLTGAECRVLMALWKRAQDNDGALYAWPSADTVAADTGYKHVRDVRRHLANLRAKGYLQDMGPGTWGHLVPRATGDGTTLHTLALPYPAAHADAPEGVGNLPRGGMGNSPTRGVGNSPILNLKGNPQMKNKMPTGSAGSAARAVENSEKTPAEPAAEALEQPQATTAEQLGQSRDRTKIGPTPKRGKSRRNVALSTDAEFAEWWTRYQAQASREAGSPTRAAKAYAAARRKLSAEDLIAGLERYAGGRARDLAAAGWVKATPDACNWLEREQWQDYPDAPATPATREPGRWTPDRDGTMYRRRAADVGDWEAPETPAGLSPADADDYARADYTDWLTASGRWERSSAAA